MSLLTYKSKQVAKTDCSVKFRWKASRTDGRIRN